MQSNMCVCFCVCLRGGGGVGGDRDTKVESGASYSHKLVEYVVFY